MRLFISWSQDRSQKMATALQDWLAYVAPGVLPFLSSEIRKGEQWPSKLKEELKTTEFAVVCLTSENQNEPWINFEAGAASHRLENTLVCPLLLDLPTKDVNWPLALFQLTVCTEQDLLRLARDINGKVENPLSEARLNKAFEIAYPELANSLERIKKSRPAKKPGRTSEELIGETLEIVREQNQLLGQIAQQTAPPLFTVGENVRLFSAPSYKAGVGLVGGTFGSSDLSSQVWQTSLSAPALGTDILGQKASLVPSKKRTRPKKKPSR